MLGGCRAVPVKHPAAHQLLRSGSIPHLSKAMAKMCALLGWNDRRFAAAMSLLWLTALAGCGQRGAPPPAPPEVSVLKLSPTPVTVYEEYPGQTEAVDTVEIRARVGGILERQAYVDGADVKK